MLARFELISIQWHRQGGLRSWARGPGPRPPILQTRYKHKFQTPLGKLTALPPDFVAGF